MVVGDDQVHRAACLLHFADRPYAAVHRHHQARAFGIEMAQRAQVQAIPLVHRWGIYGLTCAPSVRQRFYQEHGSRHPIGVKVTIHDDRFTVADRAAQARNGTLHAF